MQLAVATNGLSRSFPAILSSLLQILHMVIFGIPELLSFQNLSGNRGALFLWQFFLKNVSTLPHLLHEMSVELTSGD